MTTSPSTRIAMVDDHQMFLVGIETLLATAEAAFEVTSYTSGLDLLGALDEGAAFDVIVTDLTMRDLNGLALISAIRQRGIQAPILVLSASEDAITRAHSDLAGTFRFVHKSSEPEVLIEAILQAKEAGNIRKRDLTWAAARVIEDAHGTDQVLVPKLSAKQLQILELMAQGHSNHVIAGALFISENTVKSHAKAIFRELGANSRTAAAQRARELALI